MNIAESLILRTFPETFDAQVELSVTKLAGDVSSRRYYRVCQSKVSYILQESDPREKATLEDFLKAQKLYLDRGLPVPRVFGVDSEKSWLLLEDLGDVSLQQKPEMAKLQQSLEHLISLHSIVQPELSDSASSLWERSMNLEKLSFEMEYFIKHCVEGYLAQECPPEIRKDLLQLCQEIDARPKVFSHRDFQSRNIMLHKNQSFIIDFQDSRPAALSYDAASLIWDPYVRLSEEIRKDLWEHFVGKLIESKNETLRSIWENREAFQKEVESIKVQRFLKASGSFAAQKQLHNLDRYLCYIEGAFAVALSSAEILNKTRLFDYLSALNDSLKDIIKS